MNKIDMLGAIRNPFARRASIENCCYLMSSLALLLGAALWNGFPLVFHDSGTYIAAAIQRYLPGDRPIFYSLFLYGLQWPVKLWTGLLVQSLMSFYVIRILFKLFATAFNERDVLLAILLLALCSSLPWFVGQIMPDIFSGLTILSIAIGVIGQEKLSRQDRLMIPVLLAFFVTTHLSYLVVAIVTFVGAVLLRAYGETAEGKAGTACSKFNVSILCAILVAMTMMLGVNVVKKKGVTFAHFGNVMLLAKLIDQGIGVDYLAATCPTKPLPICVRLSDLQSMVRDAEVNHRPIGAVSDDFLWGGLLKSLGGMETVSSYASEINGGAIKMYPFRFAKACFTGFRAQLRQFALGDGLIKYDETTSPYQVIKKDFTSSDLRSFSSSRQYRETLGLDFFKKASNIAMAVSALFAAVYIGVNFRKRRELVMLSAAICIGILSNAFVAGGLSAVHDRYGSRVMWLITLLGVFAFLEFLTTRRFHVSVGARVATREDDRLPQMSGPG